MVCSSGALSTAAAASARVTSPAKIQSGSPMTSCAGWAGSVKNSGGSDAGFSGTVSTFPAQRPWGSRASEEGTPVETGPVAEV